MKRNILSQKELFLFCLSAVFFWGMLAHAYGFLHNNLSHDVLNAFTAMTVEENWKIELGRFFVPLYRAVFRGPVSLPWLIGILALTWTSIAAFLVVKIFDIRSKVLIVLVAGIMTTNITNIAQIATFLYEYDCNCFALLLSVLAVYFWSQGKGFLFTAAGSFCVMASVSIYQAFFAVTVSLIVWKSVMDLLDDKDVSQVFSRGLKGILMLLLGCLLYLLLSKLVFIITEIPLRSRTNPLDTQGQPLLSFYLNLVRPALEFFKKNVFHAVYESKALHLAGYIVCGLLIVSVLRLFIVKKYRPDRILLILLLFALTPIAATCVYIMAKGKDAHDLTKYAIWLFYVFLLLFAFRLCNKDLHPGFSTQTLRAAICVLVGAMLWTNVVTANTAYVKKELEATETLSTMTRVVSMLEQQDDYVPGETSIAFIHVVPKPDVIYGMERVSAITGLAANSAITQDTSSYFFNVYKAYFSYVLQYPAQFCTDEMHARLKNDPRVQELPAFPRKGCMQTIDGVMVIKMG